MRVYIERENERLKLVKPRISGYSTIMPLRVIFKGFVERKYIPYVLSRSDLNIIHFEQSKIKKYGVSLNKMFGYFASAKPTLSDCEFKYDLINNMIAE